MTHLVEIRSRTLKPGTRDGDSQWFAKKRVCQQFKPSSK